mmetsp:Transcript_28155/g.78985  ORF Transcript_28155/g.78985 Transcript_28155/m.78985 type:complete len:317 (+) Transcript_28155:466-1416(+)
MMLTIRQATIIAIVVAFVCRFAVRISMFKYGNRFTANRFSCYIHARQRAAQVFPPLTHGWIDWCQSAWLACSVHAGSNCSMVNSRSRFRCPVVLLLLPTHNVDGRCGCRYERLLEVGHVAHGHSVHIGVLIADLEESLHLFPRLPHRRCDLDWQALLIHHVRSLRECIKDHLQNRCRKWLLEVLRHVRWRARCDMQRVFKCPMHTKCGQGCRQRVDGEDELDDDRRGVFVCECCMQQEGIVGRFAHFAQLFRVAVPYPKLASVPPWQHHVRNRLGFDGKSEQFIILWYQYVFHDILIDYQLSFHEDGAAFCGCRVD